jgi:hypothetical protein
MVSYSLASRTHFWPPDLVQDRPIAALVAKNTLGRRTKGRICPPGFRTLLDTDMTALMPHFEGLFLGLLKVGSQDTDCDSSSVLDLASLYHLGCVSYAMHEISVSDTRKQYHVLRFGDGLLKVKDLCAGSSRAGRILELLWQNEGQNNCIGSMHTG